MAESTHSSITEPDNAEAVRVMREKRMALSSAPLAEPMAFHIPDTLEGPEA